jgi:hypothetical protein
MKRLALVLLSALLVGCNGHIRPDDAVQTEADAIKLARANCSPGPNDLEDWGASRDHDVWNVWWSSRMSSASAQIRKSDGEFLDCQVNLVPG